MAALFNPDGTPAETVHDDAVPDLVLGGKLGFQKGSTVGVVSPSGDHFQVPAEEAGQAFRAGYTFESDGQRAIRKETEKYSTTAQIAKTGVEGALSGATVGASDLLEAALLGNAKDIEARARVNRGTHGVSEMGGAIAGMLLGDELGIASPIAAVSDIGRGVEEGVGALGGAGTLARGAQVLARGATEGSVLGAASEFHNEVLKGDPIDAQKILSAAGTDALYGGGASGVLHVLGAVARGGVGISRKMLAGGAPGSVPAGTLDSVDDLLSNKLEKDPSTILGKLRSVFVGKDKLASMGRLTGSSAERELAFRAESDVDRQIIDLSNGLDEHASQMKAASKAITNTIKRPEIVRGVSGVDPVKVREAAFNEVQFMRSEVARMHANPHEFFNSPKIEGLQKQIDYLDKVLGVEEIPTSVNVLGGVPVVSTTYALNPKKAPGALEIWDALDGVRGHLDLVSKLGEMIPATERPAATVASQIRYRNLKSLLEDQNLWGTAASTQAKFNRLSAQAIQAEETFWDEFGSKSGAKGGKATYKVDTKAIRSMMDEIGTPENEARRAALTGKLHSDQEIADALSSDPTVAARFSSTVKMTDDLARLGRARADLKRLSENSGSALSIMASPLGRAILGHSLAGPAGAVAGLAASPRAIPAALHLMDQIANARSTAIASWATSIARGVKPAGRGAKLGALEVLNSIRWSDQPRSKKARTIAEATAQHASEIRALAADPARRMELARAAVGPISPEHPKLAAAAIAQGEKTFAYLNAHVPPAADPDPMDPTPVPPGPALSDQIEFADRVRIAARPMMAMEDLANGRLTDVAAETLRTVAPELHAEMVKQIMASIRDSGRAVDYQRRLAISAFIGAPLEATTDPIAVGVQQTVYALAEQAAQPGGPDGGNPKLKSTKDLKSARAAASATDKLEFRKELA